MPSDCPARNAPQLNVHVVIPTLLPLWHNNSLTGRADDTLYAQFPGTNPT